MEPAYYTHARFLVKPGCVQDFIEAWKAMDVAFAALPFAAGHGTLLRSVDQPNLYYSFGAWRSLDDIRAMRTHPNAQAASPAFATCATKSPPAPTS